MLALLVGALVATVWALDMGVAFALLVLLAVWYAVRHPVRLLPRVKRPGTHRWAPAIGLAVTTVGVFPFFTITRRRR